MQAIGGPRNTHLALRTFTVAANFSRKLGEAFVKLVEVNPAGISTTISLIGQTRLKSAPDDAVKLVRISSGECCGATAIGPIKNKTCAATKIRAHLLEAWRQTQVALIQPYSSG